MIATTMNASTPLAPPMPRVYAMAEARLCLLPEGTDSKRLDGAWWPRSRNLRRELPSLVAGVDPRFGRIDRVTVNTSLWPEPPRRIAVAGRTISVGHFPAGRRAVEICVLSNNAGRWDLLVVPPECEFAEAEMSLAAGPGTLDRPTTEAWLTRTTTERTAAADQRSRESTWESEGGHSAEKAMGS